jgi:hypothetical protein
MPTTTSRYVNDPRVTSNANGASFTVEHGGERYQILHTDVFGWMVCQGPNLDFVQVEGGPSGFGIGFGTADDAIGLLIGDPAGGNP